MTVFIEKRYGGWGENAETLTKFKSFREAKLYLRGIKEFAKEELSAEVSEGITTLELSCIPEITKSTINYSITKS